LIVLTTPILIKLFKLAPKCFPSLNNAKILMIFLSSSEPVCKTIVLLDGIEMEWLLSNNIWMPLIPNAKPKLDKFASVTTASVVSEKMEIVDASVMTVCSTALLNIAVWITDFLLLVPPLPIVTPQLKNVLWIPPLVDAIANPDLLRIFLPKLVSPLLLLLLLITHVLPQETPILLLSTEFTTISKNDAITSSSRLRLLLLRTIFISDMEIAETGSIPMLLV